MKSQVTATADGEIAVVTIDAPPVNVFTRSLRQELLEIVSQVGASDSIQAIVLLCNGKTFVSGADLSEFDGEIGTPHYHVVFNAIESLNKPVIAAVHGTALGAGVELALACHYRVAAANAQMGMPEVTLGVVPGAGGTQRLPRLIGAKGALELMLSGKPIAADEALTRGLVDEIATGNLRDAAVAFARRLNGASPHARRTRDLILRDADEETFTSAATLARKTLRGRSTPALIIEAVRAACTLPFEEGLRREGEISSQSLRTPESRALRHLFFAERQTGKLPFMKSGTAARPIARVGIVGAGTMGAGIAMACADSGLPVTILDVNDAALTAGLGRMKERYRTSDLIRPTTRYEDLCEADLIIEAAPEKMSVKQEVFRRLDAVARPGAILATNTSTLDVNRIAAVTGRPQDVIGLHFFSPANVMRLMEIVRATQTGADVIASAFELARRIRKIGVLSGVCYGFIGNRMMDPYAREAERALLEGATAAQVDSALEEFGMAMGVLAVRDLAGLDVGTLARRERGIAPPDATYYRCSTLLYERGFFGQKTGRGFYIYEGRERRPHPEAHALFTEEARRLSIERRVPTAAEIQCRCLYALVNEGARILEEGIALRAADIDVVYTAGYGFPRHRGGPMFWADSVGLDTVLAGIEEFAARFGPAYWQPTPLLTELARTGKRFAEWHSSV